MTRFLHTGTIRETKLTKCLFERDPDALGRFGAFFNGFEAWYYVAFKLKCCVEELWDNSAARASDTCMAIL